MFRFRSRASADLFFSRRSFSKLPPFNYTPPPYKGLAEEEIQQLREDYLNPGLLSYYHHPLLLVEGKMQYLFDQYGKRYLDAFGGNSSISVGHCHPYVTKIAKEQLSKLVSTCTLYMNPAVEQYTRSLTNKLPGELKVCYFVESGSHANQLAIEIARAYSGNNDIISLRHSSHGVSLTSVMGMTGLAFHKFEIPQGFSTHYAASPNGYRGKFKYIDPQMAIQYANDIQDLIQTSTNGKIAGFISEPIQASGGVIVLPPGYLPRAYDIVRSCGGLCISDESHTGLGRIGDSYWGFGSSDVIPDIVTISKGIGNGFPMAAVVTTPEIASAVSRNIPLNELSGNSLGSAIGTAVLEVIDKEYMQLNALEQGQLLEENLRLLKKKYSSIGDIRGKGLLFGVEIVNEEDNHKPHSALARFIIERSKHFGLLIGSGGLYGNVLRLSPPMCVNQYDIDFIVDCLEDVLKEVDTFSNKF